MKNLLLLVLLLSSILLNAGELEKIQQAFNNNNFQQCEELGFSY